MACFDAEPAATPIMRLAVDTIASSEPSTAAQLDPVPQFATHERLMLSRMTFLLVAALAEVDWLGEQAVKRSAREWLPAPAVAVL
jgi:hypothetical protein